jgi:hypothetical protein
LSAGSRVLVVIESAFRDQIDVVAACHEGAFTLG